MRLIIILIISGIFLPNFAFAQQESFAESVWKTFDLNNSDYQRVITISPKGKSLVKDYYITGELLMEGSFSYVDADDPRKDIPDGPFVWYFKNGNIKMRTSYINGLEDGIQTVWYESGNKAVEVNKSGGKSEGEMREYYESGQIRKISNFNNGLLNGLVREFYPDGVISREWLAEGGRISGQLIEYYESGNRKRVLDYSSGEDPAYTVEYDEEGSPLLFFEDEFPGPGISGCWCLITIDPKESVPFSVIQGRGLFMDSRNSLLTMSYVRVPVNEAIDFLIETNVTFLNGGDSLSCGIVWGLKDLANYNYYLIAPDGFCRAGSVSGGKDRDLFRINKSDSVIRFMEGNVLSIKRVNGRVCFMLNGKEIATSETISHFGENVGLIMNGKRAAVFNRLSIRQKLSK